MKKPRLERGPKLNSAMTQPQATITSGVRQLATARNRRTSPSVTAIPIPRWLGRIKKNRYERAKVRSRPATQRRLKLMHPHGKPNPQSRAAMQPCKVAGACQRVAVEAQECGQLQRAEDEGRGAAGAGTLF